MTVEEADEVLDLAGLVVPGPATSRSRDFLRITFLGATRREEDLRDDDVVVVAAAGGAWFSMFGSLWDDVEREVEVMGLSL